MGKHPRFGLGHLNPMLGDANGIALAPGESCALDAGAGAAFQVAIREQLLGQKRVETTEE